MRILIDKYPEAPHECLFSQTDPFSNDMSRIPHCQFKINKKDGGKPSQYYGNTINKITCSLAENKLCEYLHVKERG